jgi:hypothetical protein
MAGSAGDGGDAGASELHLTPSQAQALLWRNLTLLSLSGGAVVAGLVHLVSKTRVMVNKDLRRFVTSLVGIIGVCACVCAQRVTRYDA